MSCVKVADTIPTVDVIDILDAWIVEGGLDLNEVKKERPLSLDKRDISYTFWIEPGFSCMTSVYWIEEDRQLRQFLLVEVALCKLQQSSKYEAMEFALKTNQGIPSPFKLALNDELIVLVLRVPIDGVTTEYLKGLVGSVMSCCSLLYQRIYEKFQIPSFMNARRTEEKRDHVH